MEIQNPGNPEIQDTQKILEEKSWTPIIHSSYASNPYLSLCVRAATGDLGKEYSNWVKQTGNDQSSRAVIGMEISK